MGRKRLYVKNVSRIGVVDRGDNVAPMVFWKRASDVADEGVDVTKAPMKTDGGTKYPKSDYAYTPSDEPSSWKLRLTSTPGGKPDPRIVGAAVAALGSKGYRGNRVQIPEKDRAAVVGRVRRAWHAANPDKDKSDMPEVLKAAGDAVTFDDLMRMDRADDARGEFAERAGYLVNALCNAIAVNDPKGAEASLKQFGDAMGSTVSGYFTKSEDAMEPEKTGLLKTIAKALGFGEDVINDGAEAGAGEASDQEGDVAKAEIEALTKRTEAAEAVAKQLAEKVETLEVEKRRGEFVAKARSYRHLPIKAETFGEILRKIADGEKLTEDELAEHARALAAGSEANRTEKLFGEYGSNQTDGGDIEAQVAAEVEKVQKANPNLGGAEARAQVWRTRPDLFNKVEAARVAKAPPVTD